MVNIEWSNYRPGQTNLGEHAPPITERRTVVDNILKLMLDSIENTRYKFIKRFS